MWALNVFYLWEIAMWALNANSCDLLSRLVWYSGMPVCYARIPVCYSRILVCYAGIPVCYARKILWHARTLICFATMHHKLLQHRMLDGFLKTLSYLLVYTTCCVEHAGGVSKKSLALGCHLRRPSSPLPGDIGASR